MSGKTRFKASKIYAKGFGLAIGEATADLNPISNVRVRATAAQVNAAGGYTVLAGVAGKKIRMVDCKIIAVGGTTAGVTGIQVKTTKVPPVVLVDAKLAAISRSAVARAGAANVNVLGDGASFVAQGDGEGIVVEKDGGDLTGATHVDVIFDYVLED